MPGSYPTNGVIGPQNGSVGSKTTTVTGPDPGEPKDGEQEDVIPEDTSPSQLTDASSNDVNLPTPSTAPTTPNAEPTFGDGTELGGAQHSPPGSVGTPLDAEPEFEAPAAETPLATAESSDEVLDSQTQEIESLPLPPPEEWNFMLPRLPRPLDVDLIPGGQNGTEPFSMRTFAGAIQNKLSLERIHRYLDYHAHSHSNSSLTREVKTTIEGFPGIFYVVERNDTNLLRYFVRCGGNIQSVYAGDPAVPLLGFVIANAETIQKDTSLMVTTLLSMGASASCIPNAFYQPFIRDLPDGGPDESCLGANQPEQRWCTSAVVRARLARTMTLTQRYCLDKSVRSKKPSVRHRQVAKLRGAEALLGIHYFLIGQTWAARALTTKLLSYMTIRSRRPLVLVFAGPSGHGKTELARRLGHLMSLDISVVDCTIFSREAELFGPRAPYVGSERGSPLNNFLASHNGQRSIVFLDEFEKTTADIHQTLLIPFDKGEYQDRRHLTTVDCSKTIWILATNALDPIIHEFCQRHGPALFSDDDYDVDSTSSHDVLIKELCKKLKANFLDRFEAPLTGRITGFLPFLNFSPGEQAVIAHKYVMELAEEVAKPVSLSPDPEHEQLLGNVYLRVRRDAGVCGVIAKEYYDPKLGARSLITGVNQVVKEPLVEAYLDVDEEINDGQPQMEFVVDEMRGDVEVRVIRKGLEEVGIDDGAGEEEFEP
ncbi:ATPase, aaa-2 [Podospora didyma]|uniref:ATPase, aaa-2 n=1 Tax=Podospora didyma TaxID=330526 RepID=A0AAE0KJD5_9PEZI|nr:ATPase, aaa-2 [Podospora didyma]